MKTIIRMFALLVAVAGLAFAAFAPAASHAQPKHTSIIVGSPSTADVPGPAPCGFDGCVAANQSR
jgi:hypothetical protein